MQYLPFLLLFIGGSVLTVGDIVMKKWVMDNSPFIFVAGLLIYLVGLIFLVLSYKYTNIAVASIILEIFNIVTLLIVSWFYFHETLNIYQCIGILLGISAIFFLEMGGE